MAIRATYGANGTLTFFDDVSGQNVAVLDGPNGVLNIPSGAKLEIGGVDVTSGAGGGNVAGVASGYKVARGEGTLDGSNPTTIVTGLATVVSFVATLKGTSAPGVGTSVLTANPNASAGSFDVYAWKPTSNADPTLVASTGTEHFYWVAIGT